MSRPAFDLSLYLVADPHAIGARPVGEIVAAAVAGGVTLVQLRDKLAGTRALVDQARALKRLLDPLGVPLIVNDRVDVALAAAADGVHLGQDDMDPTTARRLLGPDALIGVSVGSPAELAATDLSAADYVGVGPVFPARSKADAGRPIGLPGLRMLRRLIDLPMVAIGGVTADRAPVVLDAGVDGIAVVSAIGAAADPAAASQALRRARAPR